MVKEIKINIDMTCIKQVAIEMEVSEDHLLILLLKEMNEGTNPPVVYYKNRIYGIIKPNSSELVDEGLMVGEPPAINSFFIISKWQVFYWNNFKKFNLEYTFTLYPEEESKRILVPQPFVYAER